MNTVSSRVAQSGAKTMKSQIISPTQNRGEALILSLKTERVQRVLASAQLLLEGVKFHFNCALHQEVGNGVYIRM